MVSKLRIIWKQTVASKERTKESATSCARDLRRPTAHRAQIIHAQRLRRDPRRGGEGVRGVVAQARAGGGGTYSEE